MRRTLFRTAAVLLVLAIASLPFVHHLHAPTEAELDAPGAAPRAEGLLARQLALWETDVGIGERARMRAQNPEWDLMSRTFLVMALANVALGNGVEADAQARAIHVMDVVIDDTLALEAEHGHAHFLLPYAHRAPFRSGGEIRSVFVDGELAMMLAARQLVAPRAELDAPLEARVAETRALMEAGPMLSAESYPDECWTFCNTLALAALVAADTARGTDEHADFARRWVATAREHLVDDETGLLVSSFTHDGRALDGPEGTSIFMAAHDLLLVDADLARDQWARAKRELAGSTLGYGWAREWPASWESPADVDSGPIVPLFEASTGASGLAILGASAFGDRAYLAELLTSLALFAWPIEDETGLRYGASNAVGDAVFLYALTYGPLWERAGAPEITEVLPSS
jgi:hypothetical protein